MDDTLTMLGLGPSYGRMEERTAACLAVHGRRMQRAKREGEWIVQGTGGGQGGCSGAPQQWRRQMKKARWRCPAMVATHRSCAFCWGILSNS